MVSALSRNIRLYPWYLALTYESLSHAVWYLYLFSYKGLSLGEMALLALLGDGVIVLCEVPTGYLADRIGRRTSMLLGIIAQALSALLFIFGDSFFAWWLAMAVCGLGDTLRSGADSALLYDSCLGAGQRKLYRPALAQATFIAQCGLVFGAIIGGIIATRIAWELPFWIEVAVSTAGFCVVLAMVEAPRLAQHDDEDAVTDDAAPDSAPRAASHIDIAHLGPGDPPEPLIDTSRAAHAAALATCAAPSRTLSFTAILARLAPVMLLAALLCTVPELAGFTMPAELATAIGLTPELLGYLYAAFELLYGLGAKLAGHKRFSVPARVLPFIGIGLAIALALLGLRGWLGLALYIGARALVDFLYGLAWPILSEEANRRTSSSVRATVLSTLNASSRLVPLALLPLSAYISEHTSASYMYLIFAATLLPLITICSMWVRRDPRKTALDT
jgi:MFS family permease